MELIDRAKSDSNLYIFYIIKNLKLKFKKLLIFSIYINHNYLEI